jgi:hypothetical protein
MVKRRAKKSVKKVKKKQDSGIFIPAGIFIGLGIGMFAGNVAAFLMLGLGVGFILMYLFRKK